MHPEIDKAATAAPRIPLAKPQVGSLAALTSEYGLAGVDWDYYNTVYRFMDFANDWPHGMVAHVAWQDVAHWRAIGLWETAADIDEYFGKRTIEAISRAVQLLGAVVNRDGATDVQPERHAIERLIMGPLARNFTDIGEDRDGRAINSLGTEPVAIQLHVSGMDRALYELLIERLGYAKTIPANLIAHVGTEIDGGWRIFEIWADRGHALATLGGEMLPAIELLARERGIEMQHEHELAELRRIVFSAKIVEAFGY